MPRGVRPGGERGRERRRRARACAERRHRLLAALTTYTHNGYGSPPLRRPPNNAPTRSGRYHAACVGLTDGVPAGAWHCPSCTLATACNALPPKWQRNAAQDAMSQPPPPPAARASTAGGAAASPRHSALHVRPELLRRRSGGSADGASQQHSDAAVFDAPVDVCSAGGDRGPSAGAYAGAYTETDTTRSIDRRIFGAIQPSALPRLATGPGARRAPIEATLVWSAPIGDALSAAPESDAAGAPSVVETLRVAPPRTIDEFVTAVTRERGRVPQCGDGGDVNGDGAARRRVLGSGMLEASLRLLYTNRLESGNALADVLRLRFDTSVPPQPPLPRSAALTASASPHPPQRAQPTRASEDASTAKAAALVTECRVNARPWLPAERKAFEREIEHRGKHFGEIARSVEARLCLPHVNLCLTHVRLVTPVSSHLRPCLCLAHSRPSCHARLAALTP